jgi:peptidoglycan/LPS O-acetylase OafA/YrhL
MILAGPNPDPPLFYNGDLRFLEVGVPAMLFAGGAIFFDVRHKHTLAKPIRFLADISFGVYLMHIAHHRAGGCRPRLEHARHARPDR